MNLSNISLRRITSCTAAVLLTLLAACSSDSPTGTTDPTIIFARIDANPNNVVSAVVSAQLRDARSVYVEYGTDSTLSERTPDVAATGGNVVIPVLGLKASTAYLMRVVATAPGAITRGAITAFRTGDLPADIPPFSITATGAPSPGYVMFGTSAGDTALGGFYALIVDNAGTIVWYRRFATQVTDFQRQPNGHFTVFSSLSGAPRHFYELDGLANVVGEYSAAGNIETGAHELRLVPGGGFALFGIRDSMMDLTAIGGPASAPVQGTVVEYHRPAGGVLLWSAFDHMAIDEAAPDIPVVTARYDPWHANAMDIDADGNLLVSFRNNDGIVKIDASTGAVLWRMGGRRNQFAFLNDPLGGFSHQHGVRRLPNGNIILFDNGNLHTPPVSRAVEYRVDETVHTAQMVWEYRHTPPIFSLALGFAQRLADGHTLICYGFTGRAVEVDAANVPQWELALKPGPYFIYRALRIASLY